MNKIVTVILLLICAGCTIPPQHPTSTTLPSTTIDTEQLQKNQALWSTSPCASSIQQFTQAVLTEQHIYFPILIEIQKQMTELPLGYTNLEGSRSNPWSSKYLTPSMPEQPNPGQLLITLGNYFHDWCTFLPKIKGDQDDGLKFIQGFAWFYFHNPAAQQFVQGINPVTGDPNAVMNKFLLGFSNERGTYMDTLASTTKVPEWVADARIEIEDYQIQQASGYKSWNQFFSRQIIIDTARKTIPSRPVTMPERDYVVVSPTDCIMNPLVQVLANTTPNSPMSRQLIENPLQLDTVIDVKNYPMSIEKLLANTPPNIKNAFVGGTGLSCVLMPNTYHHFHSPVDGKIVHAEVVRTGTMGAVGTFGYFDWPNWVANDGNVGRLGTDFSQFEVFQRGVIIIKVQYTGVDNRKLTGYVASIPVGLDTIGSVVLDPSTVAGSVLKKGYSRLGNFLYGGSLNILLFSRGLASPVIQTRLGNQITILNTQETLAK